MTSIFRDYRLIELAAACRLAAMALGFVASGQVAAQETLGRPKVDYNRQIRPILSDKCYRCHGPDAAERKGGFRLDQRDSPLKAADSGKHPIIPGDLEASELLQRIYSDDPDLQMPPPSLDKKVTAEERKLLRIWIASGADFQEHWSFVPPRQPALPTVKDRSWPANPIDHFILAKLEQAGLTPSPAASREMLIRRVSLDL